MNKSVYLILIVLIFSYSLNAQIDIEEKPLYSINEGTLIGIGGTNIRNTYFSNTKTKYDGFGLRILNERMKLKTLAGNRISSQRMLHLELSSTDNAAGTVNVFTGFVDYSYGLHYRFQPQDNLKILTGASARGLLGFMYNTQAANNTTTLHIDVDLNLSAAAIYSVQLKNYPLIFRYQVDIPFMGVLFSPKYGQSYYEIFGIGNTSGIVSFSSFHNKFAIRNYLTVDFPLGNLIVRTGYLNNAYYTDINDIKVHNVSHNFMLGLVKEFVSFGGKRLKKNQLNQSAYY
ncbi:MAG: DUF3316 domain-containing protein [Tannerella sp.]|jgi:hypothetical protein|nr:DUF3316 domain-containing protein [Tannerella sp.]